MPNVSFEFKRASEEIPPHDAEIIYVDCHDFYGSYEFRFGTVEWQWEEIDEEGRSTGNSYLYEPDEPQPPDTKLIAIVDHRVIGEDEGEMLWSMATDIDSALEKAGI